MDFINNLRFQRNKLLEKTDKYMLSDYPINEEQKLEIKEYRQKLRDLFEQENIKKFDSSIFDLPLKPTFLNII